MDVYWAGITKHELPTVTMDTPAQLLHRSILPLTAEAHQLPLVLGAPLCLTFYAR